MDGEVWEDRKDVQKGHGYRLKKHQGIRKEQESMSKRTPSSSSLSTLPRQEHHPTSSVRSEGNQVPLKDRPQFPLALFLPCE